MKWLGNRSKRWRTTIMAFLFTLTMLFGFNTTTALAGTSSWTEYYYGLGFYYKVYVPSGYQPGQSLPLMVMLHGCTEDADSFATLTQMNPLADQKNFIVLYPEMNYAANPSGCWNWYYTYNQVRDSGEPGVIKGMVDWVKSNYTINSSKVYLAGVSAGGAMASIMGVTYPDVFHAIGVGSGTDYTSAYDPTSAGIVMLFGNADPVADGDNAYYEMGKYARPLPVISFNGDQDTTVNPINGTQVMQQFAETDNDAANLGLPQSPSNSWNGQVPGGESYTVYDYNDRNGVNWLQHYVVHGMGHAWSGGNPAVSFADPSGPSETQIMWNFFTSH